MPTLLSELSRSSSIVVDEDLLPPGPNGRCGADSADAGKAQTSSNFLAAVSNLPHPKIHIRSSRHGRSKGSITSPTTNDSAMSEHAELKRRRVTQACQNCRALKAKCDGERPTCSRCRGYGYRCQWKHSRSSRPSGRAESVSPDTESAMASGSSRTLLRALVSSQTVLRQLRESLEPQDQALVDSALHASGDVVSFSPEWTTELSSRDYSNSRGSSNRRYLGQVSDVFFFNSVQGLLREDSDEMNRVAVPESYECEPADLPSSAIQDYYLKDLPERHVTDELIETYFSTIHIAYPYICRQDFIKQYESYRGDPQAFEGDLQFELLFCELAVLPNFAIALIK